jgi:hypothetical protein
MLDPTGEERSPSLRIWGTRRVGWRRFDPSPSGLGEGPTRAKGRERVFGLGSGLERRAEGGVRVSGSWVELWSLRVSGGDTNLGWSAKAPRGRRWVTRSRSGSWSLRTKVSGEGLRTADRTLRGAARRQESQGRERVENPRRARSKASEGRKARRASTTEQRQLGSDRTDSQEDQGFEAGEAGGTGRLRSSGSRATRSRASAR